MQNSGPVRSTVDVMQCLEHWKSGLADTDKRHCVDMLNQGYPLVDVYLQT